MTIAVSVLLPGQQTPAGDFAPTLASPGPFSVGAPSPAPRKSSQPRFIPALWSVSVQVAGPQLPTQSHM